MGNLLFLGPTGAGKTRVVEATAEVLFGDPRAMIKVDCAEFQHSHEIAKLIGSPPGYLGHRETHPLITQEALAQYHTDKLKISFLLFDEIEKASDALWQLLLGILDKATLTLGDNRRVDLSQTMIFLTSNLGGGEITELMTGGLGFAPDVRPEMRGGLDEKVRAHGRRSGEAQFCAGVHEPDRQSGRVSSAATGTTRTNSGNRTGNRAAARAPYDERKFFFSVTQPAREFLLREGTDMKYGARHLKRSIERHLVYPLASLLATDQLQLGDVISVSWNRNENGLMFLKEAERTVVIPDSPLRTAIAEAAVAGSGVRTISTSKTVSVAEWLPHWPTR